jgi:predicted DNA-binding antitoxin AbrB/MazE fold protein
MKIRLADLEKPLEDVELPDGTEHKVERFNGFTTELWSQWGEKSEEDRATDLQVLWDIAGRCIPTATDEQIKGLSVAQVVAVITVAAGNVEKVLAAAKNGDAGALIPETPATSSPETPSEPRLSPLPEIPDAALTP